MVAAMFMSAFLTSLVIALRLSGACMTLSACELWQIIFSISAPPTVLIGWIIAIRIKQTLTRAELKHQELVSSARIDGLTGLLNPPGFEAVAGEAFEETRRSGQPVSALLCDIDAFRGLNERYGHEAGDRVLRNLAEVLEEAIGLRSSILGRQGGDEFVVLLPGIDLNAAVTIAQSLCEACEARALVQEDPAAKFTISVGVGTEALGASELGELLRQTDAALHRAKTAGGNQVASGSERSVQRYPGPSTERFRRARPTLVTRGRGRPPPKAPSSITSRSRPTLTPQHGQTPCAPCAELQGEACHTAACSRLLCTAPAEVKFGDACRTQPALGHHS